VATPAVVAAVVVVIEGQRQGEGQGGVGQGTFSIIHFIVLTAKSRL